MASHKGQYFMTYKVKQIIQDQNRLALIYLTHVKDE